MSNVADRVVEIISKECDIPVEKLTPASNLQELGVSSVDVVQLIFAIEEEFDVTLDNDQLGADVQTVGQVVDAVEKIVSVRA